MLSYRDCGPDCTKYPPGTVQQEDGSVASPSLDQWPVCNAVSTWPAISTQYIHSIYTVSTQYLH